MFFWQITIPIVNTSPWLWCSPFVRGCYRYLPDPCSFSWCLCCCCMPYLRCWCSGPSRKMETLSSWLCCREIPWVFFYVILYQPNMAAWSTFFHTWFGLAVIWLLFRNCYARCLRVWAICHFWPASCPKNHAWIFRLSIHWDHTNANLGLFS